jgi:hypothetical protein
MEVKDYPQYLIYEDGRVWSNGNKFNKPRFLKHSLHCGGYPVVNIGGRPRFIHRLIAEHYIPNPENKPFIDHINRDRTDNRIENLRWCTQTENNNNMSERCLNKNSTTGHKFIAKTTDKYGHVGYRMSIQRKDKRHSKRFKSLDDAIKYRDEYLSK